MSCVSGRGTPAPLLGCCLLALSAATLTAAAEDFTPPSTPAEAARFEKGNALPISKFYDTPADLAATRPGALLRQEAVRDYALPAGASAVRILYHSLDADGRDVATSAAVLLPAGNPPAGGWPVIAWAHGTSGVARQCAPSAMRDVYYGEEGLDDFLKAGFAVVATDYHGLGTEGPHQYINKTAQARDVIYSIPAARAAVAQLGSRWVVDGHSQGGLAAWGVAELEAQGQDPGFLGAVSVAGATQIQRIFTDMTEDSEARFYAAFVAFGLQARSVDSPRPAEVLSDMALHHYESVTRDGCWYYGYASYLHDPSYAPFRPGWQNLSAIRRMIDEDRIGVTLVSRPILVIAGEGDRSVPIGAVRATVSQACERYLPITFHSYPSLDHDPVMIASTPEQIEWIRARFAGQLAAGNCAAQAGMLSSAGDAPAPAR
jgi:hypothetical protein